MRVSAVNPLAQGLAGWTLPLCYNSLQLDLQGWTASALWLRPTAGAITTTGSITSRTIRAATPAAQQPPERYRSSSSIALVDLHFVVRATVPGTYPGALAIGAGTTLDPSWAAPPVAFHDHRGGIQADGSINVTAAAPLGLWAWVDRGDMFNTARFTGTRVTTQLRAALVNSWGASGDTTVVAPSSCTPGPTATAVVGPGAAKAASLDVAACALQVDASNAMAAKGMDFTLGAAGFYANVTLSVWQPVHAVVEAEDAVLNSVLPLNAAPLAPGCTDHYQVSRLRAYADWTNGGQAASDTIASADITTLASFVGNDSNVALVTGSAVHGISPGSAAINVAFYNPVPAPTVVTVTDTPACLMSISVLATTGAAFEGAAAAAPSTGGPSLTALAWQAAQQLAWEGDEARVLTIAAFNDGSSVDISDHVGLVLAAPGNASSSPSSLFALTLDATAAARVSVSASASGVGPTSACGAYLSASWEVCSRPMGTGTGQLTLALPQPLAVVNLKANPPAITAASDPAHLAPLSVPTSAALSLFVSFSDTTVRDFSTDPRTTFSVTTGAALCTVQRDGASGVWYITTTGSSSSVPASQSCTVTASVAFGSAAPLSASGTVGVVALRSLLAYGLSPKAVAPPQLPPPQAPLGPSLRLLRCDARNYDQVTLWAAALLTNCSSGTNANACQLVDLNNRAYAAFTSSDLGVLDVVRGYPSDPGDLGYALDFLHNG